MARKPRLFIANLPYHVVQRGNNKNQIFFNADDYFFFLNVLREAKKKHPCFIYAYCLMNNHFHLIIEPKERDNISLLMKLVGAKYVHYINKKYKRTGTLWEGRFRCSMIDAESYFLACLRYIETNPLRAGVVNSPELYPWSSYRIRALGKYDTLIDLDYWYQALGRSSQEKQAEYRRFIQNKLLDLKHESIAEVTNKNGIIGSDKFKKKIEDIIGKEIIFREPGRPKIIKNNSDPINC